MQELWKSGLRSDPLTLLPVLLATSNHKANLDTRSGETDFISWKKIQSHVAKVWIKKRVEN